MKKITVANRIVAKVLAGIETYTDRPRWQDSSRYQGEQNFDQQVLNGLFGAIFRATISWGYQDPKFAENWERSDGVVRYRASYGVTYPDQPVLPIFENWIKVHPRRDVIPRVIDLELEQGQPGIVIANHTWELSERVADYDGARPLIYSRKNLIDKWLVPYWTDAQLNEHYYILAQYLWDRTREHPGPPALPNGLERDRVVLHQTADKKPAYSGETESGSIDWERWELGGEEDMHNFIYDTWGGVPPPKPPVTLESLDERVSLLESFHGITQAERRG